MIDARILRRLAALLLLGLVAACSYNTGYNPAYLSAARRVPATTFDGRAMILTTPESDNYVFKGAPTSFTGSATTLTIPIGVIARETSVAAFADVFRGGAEARARLPAPGEFTIVATPTVVSFSYEYNQLQNLGFAITPKVSITFEAKALDAAGATVWSRSYTSTDIEGHSYMINFSPQEEIGKLTHQVIYELASKAAVEIGTELATKGQAGVPTS